VSSAVFARLSNFAVIASSPIWPITYPMSTIAANAKPSGLGPVFFEWLDKYRNLSQQSCG
jgi:hypothetical protein